MVLSRLRLEFSCFLVFMGMLPLTILSQNHADRFIIDGKLRDFKQVPHHTFTDSHYHPDSGINLRQVYTAHDEHFFYIGFKSERPLNLTGGNPRKGQVYLYLDLDQTRKTGYLTGALGAEVTVDFTRKIMRWNRQPESAQQLDQAGIRLMPTVSDITFEVAIARRLAMEEDTVLFDQTISWQLADKRGDETLPAYDSAFQYKFDNTHVPQANPIPTGKNPSSDFRLVSHNTLDNGLIDEKRAPELKRIYQYLQPDVLTLNECWDVSAAKAQLFFNRHLSDENSESWHAVKMDEGNITVSRFPFGRQWVINDSFRLTATMVNHPKQPFLLVNAHLSCCDQNKQRQNQAKALMKFLKTAQQTGGRIALKSGTPVVVAGDMNLVGKGLTVDMLSGDTTTMQAFKPDWDYTPLKIAGTPHTHGHFNFTWQNRESGWPAGKLDYIFYTNSVLTLQNHYTLNTQKMPDSLLKQGSLSHKSTSLASDHYPLVADFKLSPSQTGSRLQPFPAVLNQASYHLPVNEEVKAIEVYNKKGRLLKQKKTSSHISLDLAGWGPGVYFIKTKLEGQARVQTFLITP